MGAFGALFFFFFFQVMQTMRLESAICDEVKKVLVINYMKEQLKLTFVTLLSVNIYHNHFLFFFGELKLTFFTLLSVNTYHN